MPVYANIFQADRSAERPVAIHHTRNHAVLGLLTVLLPLVLRHRREQIFYEDAVRAIAELNRRGLKQSAHVLDRNPQREMGFQRTGKA
ncbi:MAG: hypothetical protein ABIO86_11630 [Sphingomonas sp.]